MREAVHAAFGCVFRAHKNRAAIHAANRQRIRREREDMARRLNLPPAPGKPVTVDGLLERLKEDKR